MLIAALAIGIGIFSVMLLIAFSKKTNVKLRKAVLAALGLMLLTAIGCLVFVFLLKPADSGVPVLPGPEFTEQPPSRLNLDVLIIIAFIAALFAVIVILALRERKKGNTW
jgi:hypothetical protein